MSPGETIQAENVRQAIDACRDAGGRAYILESCNVAGVLDLSRLDFPMPLIFRRCQFNDPVRLENAHLRYLSLTGCRCQKGLDASNLVVDADLHFDEGFRSDGPVKLDDSVIRGTLWGSRAVFEDPGRNRCLWAKNLHVQGDVRMEASCFLGEVKMSNARIGGDAIFANGLFRSDTFTVNLCGARIGGQILLERTTAYGVNVVVSGGDNAMRERAPDWALALALEGREAGFRAEGTVHLEHARIGRDLVASGGSFEARDLTLRARGVEVAGDVHLRDGFEARGTVELRGARIRGDLDAQGGCFAAHHGTDEALRGFGLEVGGKVVFGPGTAGELCRLRGVLVFESCRIQKNFECVSVSFLPPDGEHGRPAEGRNGLDLSRTEVGGELRWVDNRGDARTVLRLSYAHAGHYVDDVADPTSRLAQGNLFLDGFTYDKLGRGGEGVDARLAWLRLQPLHGRPGGAVAERMVWPQTFEQLANHYRATGRPQEGKKVLFEKEEEFLTGLCHQWRRPAAAGLGRLGRRLGLTAEICWRTFLKWTVGHGYQFYRLLLFFLVFAVLGSLVFNRADVTGRIQRIDDPVAPTPAPDRHPRFNPVVYSLDTLVPVLDLHQESRWVIATATPGDGWVMTLLQTYLCLHILAGWVMASLVISGITGVFRH